jgi:hypothetical protein
MDARISYIYARFQPVVANTGCAQGERSGGEPPITTKKSTIRKFRDDFLHPLMRSTRIAETRRKMLPGFSVTSNSLSSGTPAVPLVVRV